MRKLTELEAVYNKCFELIEKYEKNIYVKKTPPLKANILQGLYQIQLVLDWVRGKENTSPADLMEENFDEFLDDLRRQDLKRNILKK